MQNAISKERTADVVLAVVEFFTAGAATALRSRRAVRRPYCS